MCVCMCVKNKDVVAVSTLKEGLVFVGQAFPSIGKISYHDYEVKIIKKKNKMDNLIFGSTKNCTRTYNKLP